MSSVIKRVSRLPTKNKSEVFRGNLGTCKEFGNIFPPFLVTDTSVYVLPRHKSLDSAIQIRLYQTFHFQPVFELDKL